MRAAKSEAAKRLMIWRERAKPDLREDIAEYVGDRKNNTPA
jgi:hypothetical protein